jgi:hypothetical protein
MKKEWKRIINKELCNILLYRLRTYYYFIIYEINYRGHFRGVIIYEINYRGRVLRDI